MYFSRMLMGVGLTGIVFLLGSLVFAHGDSFVIPPDLYGPAVVLSTISLLVGALMYRVAWKNAPAENPVQQRAAEMEPPKAKSKEPKLPEGERTDNTYFPQFEPAT